MQSESQEDILRRITPVPNSKGQLVVEVDKVNRDLQTLHRALQSSKVAKLLLEGPQMQVEE